MTWCAWVLCRPFEVTVAAWTLTEARANLAQWLAAEAAVAQAQEYTIGGMRLTRADARTIAERIAYWRREVVLLERGTGGGIRRRRVIPRDT